MLHMPHLLIPPDFTDSKTCLTSTRSPAHQDTAQKPRPRRADRKPCARSRGCKRGFASGGAACAATGISSLPPQADAAGCGDGWARAACLPTGPAETGDPVRWVWDGGEGRWCCLCVCLAVGKVRQLTEGKRLWRVPRKDGQELYRDGTQLLPGASQRRPRPRGREGPAPTATPRLHEGMPWREGQGCHRPEPHGARRHHAAVRSGRPPRTGRWHRPTASLQASQGHRPSSGVTRCEQRTRPASPGQRRRPLRLSRQAVPPAEARVSLRTQCRRPAPAATLCGALASRGFALHFWSLMRLNVFLTFTAI